MAACKDVIKNREFKRFISRVENSVLEGNGLASEFVKSNLVPPTVRQMIATGEQTGNLPTVAGRVADFYQRELNNRLQTVSKLAEPIMLLFMGAALEKSGVSNERLEIVPGDRLSISYEDPKYIDKSSKVHESFLSATYANASPARRARPTPGSLEIPSGGAKYPPMSSPQRHSVPSKF